MGWGVEAEAGERGAGLGLSTSGTRRGNYLATISRGGAPEVSPSAPTHSLACSSNPEMSTGGGLAPLVALTGAYRATASGARARQGRPNAATGAQGTGRVPQGSLEPPQVILITITLCWRRGHGVNTASRLGCPRLISISASASRPRSRSRSRSTKLSVASSGSLLRGGGRMPGGADAVKVRSLSARCRKPGVVSL